MTHYFPSITLTDYDWVHNPYAVPPESIIDLPLGKEEQLSELQHDRTLQLKYGELPLLKFWMLAKTEYPELAVEAVNTLNFSITYLWEGSRPIFEREEIMEAQSSRSKYGSPPPYDRHGPMDEHRRVVAIVGDPGSGSRYSPPRYADAPHRTRDSYRPHSREHEHSSREYSRSRDYERGYEPREKIRDEHFESRRSGGDDLRHELESRRREEPKYLSHERSRSYERSREYRGEDRPGSDLRMRITEKRADRHDDREHRSLEDRDHRPMMQPSPPGSDRRRVAPPDGYISSRVDMERGKPRDNGARPIHHHPVPGPSVRREEPPERFHQKPPPDFSVPPRPDNRFHYKAWDANPEYVPKGRAYFEHDNREDGGMMRGVPRGRGIIRGIPRGRGVMRGRPFRGMGPTRAGFMPPRGMTRRGGYIPRKFNCDGYHSRV
uniref:Uncharacterized protein n=1 Tax=Timema shepardi TaxID=629360 RepID=A0A7R9ARN1_TIMSH|nr:unnamed protein product [Timema shepardi]